MGNLEPIINGTKAEQAIAKEITKSWYLKVESWLAFVNIIVLIANISFTYFSSSFPSHVREQCTAEAELNPTAVATMDEVERYKFIDSYYQTCLHRFGLEK